MQGLRGHETEKMAIGEIPLAFSTLKTETRHSSVRNNKEGLLVSKRRLVSGHQ